MRLAELLIVLSMQQYMLVAIAVAVWSGLSVLIPAGSTPLLRKRIQTSRFCLSVVTKRRRQPKWVLCVLQHRGMLCFEYRGGACSPHQAFISCVVCVQAYFDKMPWLAVSFEDVAMRGRLNSLFTVMGIPRLVICGPDGQVRTRACRDPLPA